MYDKILNEIKNECERARKIHDDFYDDHHAYAVLKEEVDEFWDCVKADAEWDYKRSELIQIAAVAIKAIISHDLRI